MSSANWSLPTLTSTYTNFVAELTSRLDDLALGLDTVPTNIPTGAIQWKGSVNKWQKWDGTTWNDLSSTYLINVNSATKWTTPRTVAITGDISYSTSLDGSANVTGAATLSTVNGAVGTFGSTSQIPTITVNAKGLITNVTTSALASMATQAASAVAITGGTISGITNLTIPIGTGTPTEGVLRWDSTGDKLTIGTGPAFKTFVDTDSAQTLTNKTWNGTLLGLNYGGTGASSAGAALTNLLPAGTTAGYVLTTSGPGTFYWAAAGSGTYISGTAITSTRSTFTATAGQTLFGPVGTYTIGQSQLRVYINGVRQFPSAYTETTPTSFTLTGTTTAGDVVFAEVDAYNTYDPVAAGINISLISGLDSTTVQGALAELSAEKASKLSPTFTGTPTLPTGTIGITQVANNNSTALATTAYVDTNKAAKGPNSDITSLTGLTTPLSIAQGGTGLSSVGAIGNVLVSNGTTWTSATYETFPSGTRMSFQQTAAPTGWTKDIAATINDSVLRLVTGTVSSGGSTAFSTFNSQASVGATTLSIAQMPSHDHPGNSGSFNAYGSSKPNVGNYSYGTVQTQGGVGGSAVVPQGGGGSHTHSLTTSIKYYDFIIASKN